MKYAWTVVGAGVKLKPDANGCGVNSGKKGFGFPGSLMGVGSDMTRRASMAQMGRGGSIS